MNTARQGPGGSGTNTAALGFGMEYLRQQTTENYNGTSWTQS